jgi:hypothetical protein
MTEYKIFRISTTGMVTVEIVEAYDWLSLFSQFQYTGDPIFKAEIIGGSEPIDQDNL